ncbi:hypothetical protein HK104_002194 [Borealophlyctis nickersoniae]|nr:hypothetical protein HK104_002194 [Borealophlyctis nickersoniae]
MALSEALREGDWNREGRFEGAWEIFSEFLSRAPPPVLSEKAAMQLLFDVSLFVRTFEGSWELAQLDESRADIGKEQARAARTVIEALKKKIDPIDLAVVESHISSNVDRFYSRTSVILGALFLLNAKSSES